MNEQRVGELLACLNSWVDHDQRRSTWIVASCPFGPWNHKGGKDKKPSFAVSKPQAGKRQVYNCFSCGEVGLITKLVFNVRDKFKEHPKEGYEFGKALQVMVAEEDEELDLDIPDYEEEPDDPDEIIFWPEWYLHSFKSAFAFEAAAGYLKTRQITTSVAQKLDLRFDSSRQRVCFPIRDYDSKLIGLHGRHVGKHPLPYFAYGFEGRRNRLPWYGEDWVTFEKPVVITESVFDLASVRRVYSNVVAPLSAGLSDMKIKRIDNGGYFVTFFDYGTGGDSARAKLSDVLQTPHLHVVPPKEAGDPGNMSASEIKKVLGAALKEANKMV